MFVQEFASRTGLSPDAVRYYARIGLLEARRDPANGYRVFGRADLQRLDLIRHLRGFGLTLAEIRDLLLEEAPAGSVNVSRIQELLHWHLDQTRRRIVQLQAIEHRLQQALRGDIPVMDADLGGRTPSDAAAAADRPLAGAGS